MTPINMEAIIAVVTAIITFILGKLTKKFEWLESNYIPMQNMLVGVFSGVIMYMVGLSDNMITSIIICLISAFGAGGIYDFTKTKGDGEDEY